MRIEQRLAELGLELPDEGPFPSDVAMPFPAVRVHGNRAYISGHGPIRPDFSVIGPAGKVGSTVTAQEGYQAARTTALIMIQSLRRTLGDLDRVTAWLRVFGMVNVAPGFSATPQVINGFSDLILKVWGEKAGSHARSAVGMAELPFGIPVELEAEVEIRE